MVPVSNVVTDCAKEGTASAAAANAAVAAQVRGRAQFAFTSITSCGLLHLNSTTRRVFPGIAYPAEVRGRVKKKVVPDPLLLTPIFPSWASTIALAMERPTPT